MKHKPINLRVIFISIGIFLLISLYFVRKKKIYSSYDTRNQKEDLLLSVRLNDENFRWKIHLMDGRFIDFYDFKGKLNFIAIWDESDGVPMEQIDLFVDLYSQYKDKINFLFFAKEGKEKYFFKLFEDKKDFPVYFFSDISEELKPIKGSCWMLINKEKEAKVLKWDKIDKQRLMEYLDESLL